MSPDSPADSPAQTAAPSDSSVQAAMPDSSAQSAALPAGGPTAPPPNRFAFADNPLPWEPFALGVGVGCGAYVADFQDVDHVFALIENQYRALGYAVSHAGPAKLDVMRLYSVTARIEKVADLTVQLGRSDGDHDQLSTNGVIVSRRVASSPKGDLAVVLGGGAGRYGFLFTRTYGGTTPTDANGGYSSLDSIELQGGGGYWTALGGVKLRPGRHLAIDLQAQYAGMKPASANTPQTGEVSIDLSGYCFGGSISFFL